MKTNYLKTFLFAALFCGWGTINSFADDDEETTDETTTTVNYVSTTINSADPSQQDVTYTFEGEVTAANLTYDTSSDAETVGTVYNGSSYSNLYASTTSGLDRIAYTSTYVYSEKEIYKQGFWWRDSVRGVVLYGVDYAGFAVTDLKEGNKVTFVGPRFTTSGCATFYGASSVDGVEQTVYNGTNAASHTVTSTDDGVEVSVTSEGYVAFWATGSSGTSYRITSITITEDADTELFPYSYTLSYVDQNNNVLKTVIGRSNSTDEVTISSDALAEITTEDGTTYVYNGDENPTVTPSEDGSNSLTLSYTSEFYTFKITAVCGEETINSWDDVLQTSNSYTITGIPEVIEYGDAYYRLSDSDVSSYKKTFEATQTGDFEGTISYKSAPNIVYYIDDEDSPSHYSDSPVSAEGYSCGTYSKYATGSSMLSTTLNAGYYKITAKKCKTRVTETLYININSSQAASISTTNTLQEYTININIVKDNSSLTITPSSASSYYDYFIIENITDQEYTVSMSELCIATFSAPVAVEVPSGISVYSALLDEEESKLTLTKVSTDVIPANTGVILQGEANNYIFSQTESESTEDFSSNSLIAASATATASTTLTAESGYYVLTNSDGEAVFGVVAADITIDNKAYLQLTTESSDEDDTTSEAKTISIVFAETTGIESVSSEKATDGSYYNLQGVKVLSPSKGLYIKDGKKVIIK